VVAGVAGLELLTGKVIRNAVVVPVDLDVVVDVGADCFPLRHYVGFGWQWLKCGPIDLGEQRTPRAVAFAEAPIVQAFQQFLDSLV
jgi:hypothetical protein